MSAADDSLGQQAGSDISVSVLRGSILASVSRSFYLSIRLLPKKLRDPVSLGYLLARASDTIADTIDVPIDLDRKSTRLNSSHSQISYAVFCLKKKKIYRHRFRDISSAILTHRAPSFLSFSLAPTACPGCSPNTQYLATYDGELHHANGR